MAKAKQKLIPAVMYLRKSTKGMKADGSERQEKSITQQRTEIAKLIAGKYTIIREYADEGVSGWKRKGKRPGFDRMLQDAKERGDVAAVICDDLDRFSRAEVMEVFADLSNLSAAGVKTIHCVNQGEYGLGENDIGRIIKMVVDVHGGNDFSRKLSRRVCLSHRNRAKEGKRAGSAPYGFVNDGKGGLKHGNRKHLTIVRRIFKEYVEYKWSRHVIAGRLNEEGIPSPRGRVWARQTIKDVLQRTAYCGDFTYGCRQEGRFFTTATDGEVVEASSETKRWVDRGPVFHVKGIYKPVVSRATWEAAQKRLSEAEMKGSRRPRTNSLPLVGLLICDHCSKRMYGCRLKDRDQNVYRCSTPAKTGRGTCGMYWIDEKLILPQVLSMLAAEMTDLKQLLASPPEQLITPDRMRAGERAAQQVERDTLARRIEQAENDWISVDDERIRRSLVDKIGKLRNELDAMDANLIEVPEPGYQREELRAIAEWWEDFRSRAVSMPVTIDQNMALAGGLMQDRFADYSAILVDARNVNEALHSLGTEVRLRWRTRLHPLKNGKTQNRYDLVGGRFRLGQTSGRISESGGVILLKASVAGPSSDTRGGGRCGIRRGKD